MLATLTAKPFQKAGWVYEEKYDGHRILAYKEGPRVRLLSRNDKDNTARFPSIAAAVARLRPPTLLLDGEVVVFDRAGVSRFQLLQQSRGTAVYVVFDCLFADGADLRDEPLALRRGTLEKVVGAGDTHIRLSRRLAASGLAAYEAARRRGYEGLVAKDAGSKYIGARSRCWLKVKVHQQDEFVIVGYTEPEGARKHFGALLLGASADGELRYTGKVGTGFDARTLSTLYRKFKPLVRRASALRDPPRGQGITWIQPKLVAQIAYQELTAEGKLRQPVYLGLRDDKLASEVSLPGSAAPAKRTVDTPAAS